MGHALEATRAIADAIRRFRFSYGNEDDLQRGLADALTGAGFRVRREVRLNARDRIDLLIGRVGIEVKVASGPDTVVRQLTRYAEHDQVDALILVTNRARHRPPARLLGKPVTVIYLEGTCL